MLTFDLVAVAVRLKARRSPLLHPRYIPNANHEVTEAVICSGECFAMSTTNQTTQISTGFIGLRHRTSTIVNDPNLIVVALSSVLGLLASFYFITHFPVEDFLAAWL